MEHLRTRSSHQVFPLTLPQQDIYYDQLLFPVSPIYNIGAKIEIKGELNINAIQLAYKNLIDQHDAYRCIVDTSDREPCIKIIEDQAARLELVDFSKNEAPREAAHQYMLAQFVRPFDISKKELLHRSRLIKINDTFYYLFSVYHHIITDGWGTSLIFQRIVKNYNEVMEYGEVRSRYPYYYTDYVVDDLKYQQSEDYKNDRKYWADKFSQLPEMPLPFIKNGIVENKSWRKELIIRRERYDQLTELSKEFKVSVFHVILGVLFSYFGRYYDTNDLAIGLPVLNRGSSVYKMTMGLFMGLSVLRLRLDFEETFRDLVLRIRNQLRQDYRHQRYPLGKLIRDLAIFKEREKLFNLILSYEKHDYSDSFKKTECRVIPMTHGSERVALAIYIREFDEKEDVKIDFDYNLRYFDENSIRELMRHFSLLVDEVIRDPYGRLRDLDLLSAFERKRILHDFNDTSVNYPEEKTVVDLIGEQAGLNPQKVAIKDVKQEYTYAELSVKSDKIAGFLRQRLGDSNDPVAVLLDRSAELVIVLLGILKAGRPYIPLDPSFPEARLQYIIGHSAAKVIIIEREVALKINDKASTCLYVEDILSAIPDFIPSRRFDTASQSAYIIYTSGSTGNPKGVEISHSALANFMLSMTKRPGMSADDLLFAVTTYSFDISILEFFLPLIAGAMVYIADKGTLGDPERIINQLAHVRPSVIQATPSFYQMLFNAGWDGDRSMKVLCGGDLLSESLASRLLETTAEVWNMYGPTETTIWSCAKRINRPEESSDIGTPIHNTRIYLLDKWGNPVPAGAAGNIYIGGHGLAKGYYRDILLTNEKFKTNPFQHNDRIYNTGDIGRWTWAGMIEFLGRSDNQVKIRGYRIELGEIEKKLTGILGIREAIVVAKKGEDHESFLIAYVRPDTGEANSGDIIKQLKETLPDYMVPKVILLVDGFPLTPNNKIDRKALAGEDIFISYETVGDQSPEPGLEMKLLGYWKEVLGVEKIGVFDNFFSRGGQSLSAVKLAGKINSGLGVKLLINDIFNYPTIRSLAERIRAFTDTGTGYVPYADKKEFYALTHSQLNLWLASQTDEGSIANNMNSAFSLVGKLDIPALINAISHIIERHEILRTNFILIDGRPMQRVNSDFKFSINEFSCAKDPEELITRLIYQKFDLARDLLIRVSLIHAGSDKNILLFSAHHIIMDGLSTGIFIRELVNGYNKYKRNEIKEEKPLDYQFNDYSAWYDRSNAKDGRYWPEKLQGYRPMPMFPTDRRVNGISHHGELVNFEIDAVITTGLDGLAREMNTTMFAIINSLIKILIFRYSGQTDICVGTVFSGRDLPMFYDSIGLFIKVVPLRDKLREDDTLRDVVRGTKQTIIEALGHQDDPIGLTYGRIPGFLFDVLIVFKHPEETDTMINSLHDLHVKPYLTRHKYSRFPMTFNFFMKDDSLGCDLEYNADLYQAETIYIIIEKLKKLMERSISSPDCEINKIDVTLDIENPVVQDVKIDFNF